MKPQISIITIVYNGLPYLKDCITSIFKQKNRNWELLISDDGSDDGSRHYLESLSDSRVKYFKQDKNLGIFNNLNFLFGKASAPISQILCQDDYFISEHAIDTLIDYWAAASPLLGFVRFNHGSEKSKGLGKMEQTLLPNLVTQKNANFWFYLFGNIPGNLSNVSLRTSIVEDCGWFNQQYPYAGDFEFWQRAAKKYEYGVEKEAITYIRAHKNQASFYLNYNGELILQKIYILNNLYSELYRTYFRNNFLLRLHGTINFDSYHKDIAIKNLLRGNILYYRTLARDRRLALFTFKPFLSWIIFFLSLGGRIGRRFVAREIIDAYDRSLATANIVPTNND